MRPLRSNRGIGFFSLQIVTDETIPDIYQSKKLSTLYSLTLDELLNFDVDVKEIEETIKNYDEKKIQK